MRFNNTMGNRTSDGHGARPGHGVKKKKEIFPWTVKVKSERDASVMMMERSIIVNCELNRDPLCFKVFFHVVGDYMA